MDGLKVYEYPPCADAPFVPSWGGWEVAPDMGDEHQKNGAGEIAGLAGKDQCSAEETLLSFEAGRKQGIDEGRAAERSANSAALSAAEGMRITQAAELVAEFERRSSRYFQAVDQEVVKLALAVAARVLRREAQSDPLMLLGAVRVALGQIAASTDVHLRVPEKDLDLWTEAIALLPNLKTRPKVTAGEGMALGDCAIDTKLGTADLGISEQLRQIERSVLNRSAEASQCSAEASVAGAAR